MTENYVARADAGRAREIAETDSPFTIEVLFLGGLSPTQMGAFADAADRWTRIIVGDLPSVQAPTLTGGMTIDDVLIVASGAEIDGPGQVLGQAGALWIRPESAGAAAHLPVVGQMTFDTADLVAMEARGTLRDVITHEMGHVLGLSRTMWTRKGLLTGAGGEDPRFVGPSATQEYDKLTGGVSARGVPVENVGEVGSRDSHWREALFHHELMSSLIAGPGNPISRVTVASLADIGYQVDLDAAEDYALPDVRMLVEDGLLTVRNAPIGSGQMLEIVPTGIPDEYLTPQGGNLR